MPRYEFSEGSSNKFWQIELNGSEYTTTYGKIGTDGQSTTKSAATPEAAKKEYDKLIAEKVKKGYELAGGGGGGDDEDEDEEPESEKPKAKAKPAAKAEPAKAAAKAEPAKAAAPAKAAKGGPLRLEFSEGTSNKFWQISLEGSDYTTTYGKIGTDGQSTTKSAASPEAAKKEYDKLVAEKKKKGYAEPA